MPRHMKYQDVPDESDEEENWFGNADPKHVEKSNNTGNKTIATDINPMYEYDFGPTPEQAIENVRTLPSNVSRGKVCLSTSYNVILY